jgi:hypothetical protein
MMNKEEKIKVAWICDYNQFAGEGSGAELSEKAVIEEGIRKGYSIDLVLPNTPAINEVHRADLVIIGSTTRFSRQYLAKVTETTEYIMFLHDMSPICSWRAFFPDLPKCKKTCPNLNFTKKLLLNSSLNIFLTPLHYRVWCRVIPEIKNIEHYLHVPTVKMKPIDGVQRIPNSVVGINVLWSFKTGNVLAYATEHPELTFTFYGGTDNPKIVNELPKNCVAMGRVAQEEMAGIYSQAQSFIHLPSHVMAAERTVIEAKLCGIPKLILNKLVGVTSYKQFKYDRDDFAAWVGSSANRFWEKIEKEML